MLDRLKFKNNTVFAIFIVLIIANLLFFYIFVSNLKLTNDSLYDFEDLGLILSSIIIFAFISSKLPKLRKLGDSSLYDVTYFLILALITLFISYYNSVINTFMSLGSFLDMFNILAVSLIFMIVAMQTRIFKAVVRGEKSRRNLIYCAIIFSVLGVLASISIFIDKSPANVRTMTILIGSMLGGPIVGIPSAIVAGLFRLSLGGVTAVPCSISTILCGFIGSAVYILNGRRFLNSTKSAILMFLMVGLEMLFILLYVPSSMDVQLVNSIYPPMLFGSVVGIVLFKLVIKDNEEKSKNKKDIHEEVAELKESLKEHEEKIDRLEKLLDRK
ncbi:MAG: LytS/YhcK type 5TM receptor domain-containing protein [Methanobrevibacter sp.]|nr:LytS/YhcK type 5TM receptor domain-containing protein [Methanobrevibacter sp.]